VVCADPEQDRRRVIGVSLRPPSHWRRPCGRPRATWLTANGDVLLSAWRKASDRTLWRRIVDTATLHLGARHRRGVSIDKLYLRGVSAKTELVSRMTQTNATCSRAILNCKCSQLCSFADANTDEMTTTVNWWKRQPWTASAGIMPNNCAMKLVGNDDRSLRAAENYINKMMTGYPFR